MRVALTLSVGSLLLTAACGPRAANDLSREDAWRASQVTMQSGQMSGAAYAGATYSVNQSLDAPCPEGGSIAMDMAASVDGDLTGAGGANISVDVRANYSSCAMQNITIDGAAAILMNMATSQSGASVELSMSGDLWFTGEIEGSCSFNFTARASGSALGGEVELSGDYCGYDLDELQAEYEAPTT